MPLPCSDGLVEVGNEPLGLGFDGKRAGRIGAIDGIRECRLTVNSRHNAASRFHSGPCMQSLEQERVVDVDFNRRRIGEGHPAAKLSDEQVQQIRDLRARGLALSAIAAQFNVGKAAVWKVTTGRRRSCEAAGSKVLDSDGRFVRWAIPPAPGPRVNPRSVSDLASIMSSWMR